MIPTYIRLSRGENLENKEAQRSCFHGLRPLGWNWAEKSSSGVSPQLINLRVQLDTKAHFYQANTPTRARLVPDLEPES